MWRLSLLYTVPGGPCWAGDLTMNHRKAFLFFCFFFSSEFRCTYIDVQGHSSTYTTRILSCSIFYICNVDGMYCKIQMRAPWSLIYIGQLHIEHYRPAKCQPPLRSNPFRTQSCVVILCLNVRRQPKDIPGSFLV